LGVEAIGDKSEGTANLLRAYPPPVTYLSGTGARAYMEDEPFDRAGIQVTWSKHKATTNDSVLSVLFDYEDPMEIIMLTNEEDGET